METITLTIERKDTSTGNRYTIEKRFNSEMLHHCVKSVEEQIENAITEMSGQLDAKEKEVRTHNNQQPQYSQ